MTSDDSLDDDSYVPGAPLAGRGGSGQLTIFIALILHIWPRLCPRELRGGGGSASALVKNCANAWLIPATSQT